MKFKQQSLVISLAIGTWIAFAADPVKAPLAAKKATVAKPTAK